MHQKLEEVARKLELEVDESQIKELAEYLGVRLAGKNDEALFNALVNRWSSSSSETKGYIPPECENLAKVLDYVIEHPTTFSDIAIKQYHEENIKNDEEWRNGQKY